MNHALYTAFTYTRATNTAITRVSQTPTCQKTRVHARSERPKQQESNHPSCVIKYIRKLKKIQLSRRSTMSAMNYLNQRI